VVLEGARRSARPARASQSIAFFSCPGTDELYSGVANTIASAPAIASRNWVTANGGAGSSSSSNGGMSFSRSSQ
jgi:hypothetical protein